MEEQRDRARAAFKGGAAARRRHAYRTCCGDIAETDFSGYDHEGDTGSGAQHRQRGRGGRAGRARASRSRCILDRTPFYAESGGQVGDTGTIITPSGKVAVGDTVFSLPGVHGHRGHGGGGLGGGRVRTPSSPSARCAESASARTTPAPTCSTGRCGKTLVSHVHQAGSRVEPDRLRFDFSHFEGLDDEALADVEGDGQRPSRRERRGLHRGDHQGGGGVDGGPRLLR